MDSNRGRSPRYRGLHVAAWRGLHGLNFDIGPLYTDRFVYLSPYNKDKCARFYDMTKATNPIPEGFRTLTPHLTVTGAADYIDFLKRAFNAVEVSRAPGPGGKLMHAEVRIGNSPVIFADDFGAEFGMPPLAQGRMPFNLQLYVPDADASYVQAVDAGCKAT